MKRKILLLTALISTMTAWAGVGSIISVNNLRYKVTSENPNTVELIGYEVMPSGTLTVRPTVNDGVKSYAITSICDKAFLRCNDITKVFIGKNVIKIGKSAFQYCSGMTSLSFVKDGQLTNIDEYAFMECSSLTSVDIPAGVQSIGENTFGYCYDLKSVSIPASLTNCNSLSFACSGIWTFNVDLGNANFSAKDGVLFNKDQTTIVCFPPGRNNHSYTIPDGVTCIGIGAFGRCVSLESITIPYSVTRIEDYAFIYCYNVTDVYCYANPANLTWVEDPKSFMENKATKCHVNDVAAWANRFYHVNVTFVGGLPAGIDDLSVVNSQEKSTVYNFSALRINNLRKGLNIMDGKKVLVR